MPPADSQEMTPGQEDSAPDKRLIFFGEEPYHLVEQIPQEGEVLTDFLLWQFHNGIGQSE